MSVRPSRRRNPASDQAGSASVLAAFLIAGLLVLALAGVGLGGAVVARHRAQSAADLAALSAALRLPAGAAAACGEAEAVAAAMKATLHACRVERLDVAVTVTASTGGVIGRRAQASARAGPVMAG